MPFNVNVYTPLSQETATNPRQLIARLDNAITAGNFDRDIAGGFTQAKFTLRPGWLDTVPSGAHVEVREKGNLRWEGMRVRPKRGGRHIVALECRGYALALTDCNPLQTAGITSPSYDGAGVIAVAMQNAPAPGFSIGPTWQIPSVYHSLSEFDGRTPWQIQQSICAESGYDWQVWDDRQMTLTQRVAPNVGAADYQVPLDWCQEWEEDDSTIFTRITVKYTDSTTGSAATTQQFVDSAAETRLGVSRATILSIGKVSAAYAANYAQTRLRATVYPQVRAVVSFSQLRATKAIAVQAAQVRPGQWVQVGAPEEPSRPPQVIVHSSVAWNGMGTFQLGAPPLDAVGAIVGMQRVTSAVLAASNPLTGAAA